jgi:uncharacterized protein (TIGR02596 family)
MRTPSSKNRAFSLLEMIVVILIIGIVAAFVTPAVSTIMRGSQLTQATQILTDQITLARQLALTKNCQVEVRFIKYVDPGVPSDGSGAFRAIQCFEILEKGAAIPMDKPQLLPQAIVMSSGSLSTLLSDTAMQTKKASNQDPELPRGIDRNYQYVPFRFLPDGSTNLPIASGTIWFVTLHNMNDTPQGTNPPSNFFTLQIDPVSGTTKFYRPSV